MKAALSRLSYIKFLEHTGGDKWKLRNHAFDKLESRFYTIVRDRIDNVNN